MSSVNESFLMTRSHDLGRLCLGFDAERSSTAVPLQLKCSMSSQSLLKASDIRNILLTFLVMGLPLLWLC